MKKYTHVFWDFNGTLFDDVDACIHCANRLLTGYALAPLPSKEAYRAAFGFPIRAYYQALGFDFERISYDRVAKEWVAMYLEESRASCVYPQIPGVLLALRDMGFSQWVLSATEAEMLKKQLDALSLSAYFDGVLGADTIHAFGKEEIALAWYGAHPQANVLLIGDTDHDAKVAQLIGADCILLSAGHQSRERLEKCACLFVADSAQEVLGFLQKAAH